MENNLITHNPSLGVFTVLGTTGNPHAVRLFPKESCTCPSTTQCYHILAAKMSIGMENNVCKRKINLTQLRRNTRPKQHKKSGRKAPRPDDYDVHPAPDSTQESKSDQHQVPIESQITPELNCKEEAVDNYDVEDNVQEVDNAVDSNVHVPVHPVTTGTFSVNNGC